MNKYLHEALSLFCTDNKKKNVIPNLPQFLNYKDKHKYLETDGKKCSFRYEESVNLRNDVESGMIRSNIAIPQSVGVYYFEVKITGMGKLTLFSVGFASGTASTNSLPGFERNTYGFFSDGRKSSGTISGEKYGRSYHQNCIVGCCINFMEQSIFFTLNGVSQGIAFRNVNTQIALYPAVGLSSEGESLEVNFGDEPFMFDFKTTVSECRNVLRRTIENTELPTPSCDKILRSLVLGYLSHYAYSKTAEYFAKETGQEEKITQQLSDMKNRQMIREFIVKGDIDNALDAISRFYPTVLKNQDIVFKLKCQKFIEMIRSSNINDTLRYGQTELASFYTLPEYEHFLREVFSLIAYIDPYNCTVSYLLDESKRLAVADAVNLAILQESKQRKQNSLQLSPALELIVRQCDVTAESIYNHNLGNCLILTHKQLFQ